MSRSPTVIAADYKFAYMYGLFVHIIVWRRFVPQDGECHSMGIHCYYYHPGHSRPSVHSVETLKERAELFKMG